jgi:imidazole glycerol-phosphate synthase subunit HisH
MTVIIDYGVGNIGSIANMLKRLDEPAIISADPKEIEKADRLVLCGIGAFDDGMKRLEKAGITELIQEKALVDKTPILGICLGMQMFTEGSEEGEKKGLGLVKAHTKKFRFDQIESEKTLRIPHMGWNSVTPSKESGLLSDMYADPRFYFVHSFLRSARRSQRRTAEGKLWSAFHCCF